MGGFFVFFILCFKDVTNVPFTLFSRNTDSDRIRIGFGSVSDRFDPNSNSDRIGSNPNGFGPDSDQN